MESEQQLTKAQLIASIADLQTTLRELNDRSETVKSENDSLREENIVYRDYINNLMSKVRSQETA